MTRPLTNHCSGKRNHSPDKLTKSQVWVLDTLPGEVRAGDSQRKDHAADLISCLQRLDMPLRDRTSLQLYLSENGFSNHIAKWTSTNLRAKDGDVRSSFFCACLMTAACSMTSS